MNPKSNGNNTMHDNGARLGQGTVQMILGEETVELKPTVHAFMTISKQFGGLQNAMEKVSRLDVNAIHEIAIVGAHPRYSNTKDRQELLNKIFAAGLGGPGTDEVGEKILRFLGSLLRGGRPMPDLSEVEGEAQMEGNASSSS